MLGAIRQLDFLDAGRQSSHVVEVEPDSTDEVVEVALGKAQLDALVVLWSHFEAVDYLQHQEEGGRRTVGFFVFVLGELPISHYIPDYLALVDGGLL